MRIAARCEDGARCASLSRATGPGWPLFRLGMVQRAATPIRRVDHLAVFLFLINVFSGLDHVWFHWPAVPLLLIAILWDAIQRKPS